jgi:uncharacterized iron-regulated protein
MTRRPHLLLRTLSVVPILFAAACAVPPPALDDSALPRLRAARFVLLGEVHDNPIQHRMRATLLTELLADGRPTTVVFEQMGRAEDAAIAAAPRDAEAIADAGRLDRKGWGWPLHKPLFEAAIAASARVAGGNLEAPQVRAIVREGLPAVPADLRPLLEGPGWSARQQQALEREIDAGHCHALPAAQWPAMALAQRARDAALAQALLSATAAGGRAVLIAGNGHVRRDLGVPHYLRAAGVPAAQIVAIGYLEEDERDAPYDLVRITSSVPRDDPCAAFAR